jgi:SAM-dependent methyltransferase
MDGRDHEKPFGLLMIEEHLPGIYGRRFGASLSFRSAMWKVLCEDFFQAFVPVSSTVVEVGAGYCEFINHIRAARRIALDLNPETPRHAAHGVSVVTAPSHSAPSIETGSADRVFASNFFEHLSRDAILLTLTEIRRILKPGGQLLILQPNIRYCYRDYWMFFDHLTPLDDRSLAEALQISGFQIVHVVRRFLPFTTQSRLPKSVFFVRAYLRIPLLWRLFGAQSFVVAEPERR